MRRRVSILGLMGLILLMGLGFAALRSASAFWASFLFTLAYLMVTASTIAAIASPGRERASWAGFAVACGGHLALVFGPLASAGGLVVPPLLTTGLISRTLPTAPPGHPWLVEDSENVFDDASVVREKVVEAPPGFPNFAVPPAPGSDPNLPPTVINPKDVINSHHYFRIANILGSIIIGFCGYALGWALSRRQLENKAG